jgi:aspartyl/asparaginyl-tRNA synthetase
MSCSSNLNKLHINPHDFHNVIQRLRTFFIKEGFVEAHLQNRLSILAACEDPGTISKFNYMNSVFPLPQTSQMWLEHLLLEDPSPNGYFSVATSYRDEPNPVAGRHDKIFPMFEFELKGGFNDMLDLQKRLLTHLGYDDVKEGHYMDIAKKYNVFEIEHEHEAKLAEDYGNAFMLKEFPRYTSPFWNMKKSTKDPNIYMKCDTILSGFETIGAAERSCDPEQMKHDFDTISDGMYAKTIYGQFGKERVDEELTEFLGKNFFERSGGGIGVTRLIKSMQNEKLM